MKPISEETMHELELLQTNVLDATENLKLALAVQAAKAEVSPASLRKVVKARVDDKVKQLEATAIEITDLLTGTATDHKTWDFASEVRERFIEQTAQSQPAADPKTLPTK